MSGWWWTGGDDGHISHTQQQRVLLLLCTYMGNATHLKVDGRLSFMYRNDFRKRDNVSSTKLLLLNVRTQCDGWRYIARVVLSTCFHVGQHGEAGDDDSIHKSHGQMRRLTMKKLKQHAHKTRKKNPGKACGAREKGAIFPAQIPLFLLTMKKIFHFFLFFFFSFFILFFLYSSCVECRVSLRTR